MKNILRGIIDFFTPKKEQEVKRTDEIEVDVKNEKQQTEQEKFRQGAFYGSPVFFPTRSRKIKNKLNRLRYGK